MDSQQYYSTLAQVLPVLTIAGAVELRYLIKRCYGSGGVLSTDAGWMIKLTAHLYVRFLAGCSFASLLLTVSCANAVLTQDYESFWIQALLPTVFPFMSVLVALPLLGAVFSPRDLLRWYGEAR